MSVYDPNVAPDGPSWVALDEQERITLAIRAHEGRFPDALHSRDGNEIMHGSLHAIIETQIANGDPPATGRTVSRLVEDGLTRHAATHAVMEVLAHQLAGLGQGGARFDHERFEAELDQLTAPNALEAALKSSRMQDADQPMNRAQRRAAKKKKKKKS